MAANDPHQAVIDYLCGPAGSVTATHASPGGWQSATVHGGPLSSADRGSIVFLKERTGPQRWLTAVSYHTTQGHRCLDFYGVRQQTDGSWTIEGGASGSDSEIPRDQPWVNLGGWWSQDLVCAGGRVTGQGAQHARRVQLVFDDGHTVEDPVEQNLVLFLTEHSIRLPATVHILDGNGGLLASHDIFASTGRTH